MKKRKILYKRIEPYISKIGNITFVFTALDIISSFNSWSEFYNFIQDKFQSLVSILDFFTNIIHFILIPWKYVINTIHFYNPFELPIYLYSPLMLSLLILNQLISRMFNGKRAFDSFVLKHLKPLSEIKEIISSESDPNKLYEKILQIFKENDLGLYIASWGPVFEYHKLIGSSNSTNKNIVELKEKVISYITFTEDRIEANVKEYKPKPFTYIETLRMRIFLILTLLLIIDFWIFKGFDSASLFLGSLILTLIILLVLLLISFPIFFTGGFLFGKVPRYLYSLVNPEKVLKYEIDTAMKQFRDYLNEDWLIINNVKQNNYEAYKSVILEYHNQIRPSERLLKKIEPIMNKKESKVSEK